jgi:hypothetical protein
MRTIIEIKKTNEIKFQGTKLKKKKKLWKWSKKSN